MVRPRQGWSVPVRLEDIPEAGRRFDLQADPAIRAAVARIVGVPGIDRLQAEFELRRRGPDGLQVLGSVSASVRQTCVVTLEGVTNEIQESVELIFAAQTTNSADTRDVQDAATAEAAEPLADGMVDLGAVAVEFLLLGIDPYPRKPGAVFEAPQDMPADAKPLAALAALKKNPDRNET